MKTTGETPGEHPRLDWLLENWVRYMRGYDMHIRLDAKTSDFWASGNSDFDGMVNAADLDNARVTNAAIEDLSQVEQASIHHMHLSAVWRTNREPIEQVYLRARITLSDGLRMRKLS